MNIHIFDSKADLSRAAAALIEQAITANGYA
jgi:hypothetical protein